MKPYNRKQLMKVFSRAAGKPELSGGDFLDAILRERPDLKGKTAYAPQQGAFAYTLVFENEVFKAPRRPWHIRNMKKYVREFDREADVLQALEGKGLPVPRVTCRGRHAVFYGMTRIKGAPLESLYDKLSQDELQTLAGQVADFVVAMARKLPRSKDGLYAMQGDLKEANILINPKTKKLTGIVDFGLTCYVTKDDLTARWTRNLPFREMINAALAEKKSVLPDSPPTVKSRYAPSDPYLHAGPDW